MKKTKKRKEKKRKKEKRREEKRIKTINNIKNHPCLLRVLNAVLLFWGAY